MIVVSHRGPVPVRGATTTAAFVAQRGRGRRRQRARRRCSHDIGDRRDVDRGRDRRRRPRRGRGRRRRRSRASTCACSTSIPSCTACTTTSCRTACCGSCIHGLFDRARRPRFDRRFREAWDALRRGERSVRRRRRATPRPRASIVLVHDYQLALVPGQLRALRPDLRVVHFTHTPFCGPDAIRGAARPTWPRRAVRVARRGARRASTPRAGPRAYAASARDVLGRRATITPPFAAQPRTRRRRARRGRAPSDGAARRAAALDDAGRRPPRDRAATASSRRRTSCAASSRTTGCSKRAPGCAGGSCSSRCCTRRGRTCAEYLAYEQRGRAGRRARRTSAGRRATGSRSCSTTRDDFARSVAGHAALRRAAREPDQGRAQPRGQGRARSSTAATACCASRPRRARTRSCTTRCSPCTRTTSNRARRARHRARSMPLDERAARARRAARRSPRCTRRAPGSTICSARRADRVGERVEQRGEPRGPVDHDVGRVGAPAGSRRTSRRCAPRARACPSATDACERGERGQVAGVVARERARPSKPRDELGDASCPCRRHRRPQLDRHAAAERRFEAESRRGLGRPARRPRPPRSGWSRQCTVTATPPLRSTSSPGSAASASSAACATASRNGRTRSSSTTAPATIRSSP